MKRRGRKLETAPHGSICLGGPCAARGWPSSCCLCRVARRARLCLPISCQPRVSPCIRFGAGRRPADLPPCLWTAATSPSLCMTYAHAKARGTGRCRRATTTQWDTCPLSLTIADRPRTARGPSVVAKTHAACAFFLLLLLSLAPPLLPCFAGLAVGGARPRSASRPTVPVPVASWARRPD